MEKLPIYLRSMGYRTPSPPLSMDSSPPTPPKRDVRIAGLCTYKTLVENSLRYTLPKKPPLSTNASSLSLSSLFHHVHSPLKPVFFLSLSFLCLQSLLNSQPYCHSVSLEIHYVSPVFKAFSNFVVMVIVKKVSIVSG